MAKKKSQIVDCPVLELVIPERIVPKARPRFSKGRAFMPKNYRDNQQRLIECIVPQFDDYVFNHDYGMYNVVIKRCSLEIIHNGYARGDADNISGSIMDALVKGEVLTNDNVNCIYRLKFTHNDSKDSEGNPTTYCYLRRIVLESTL